MTTQLSPTQQSEFDRLMKNLHVAPIWAFFGDTGMGKTTVLREIHRAVGGAFLTLKDFVDAMQGQHPLALEETFEKIVMEALRDNDRVVVDDLHLIHNVVCCGHFYPRMNYLIVPLASIAAYAEQAGKTLIFGTSGHAPGPIDERCYYCGIREFAVADYAFLCGEYLGQPIAGKLNYEKIHRFAPKLNAHRLKSSCLILKSHENLDTETFIGYLRERGMTSNIQLSEVQVVDLHDLKGVDDVVQSLEASIILPLENDELASELQIRPKRGVLLAGPPGTGKTTVGRALAHRLKSKFFLIDGTFVTQLEDFYRRVHAVFEGAKQNAPSIIFIDDSDTIFESDESFGLYRYLLSMLDGLETESAGRVCVMMTAMNVGSLPPALVRSGRIELWLEMHLPNQEARAAILRDQLARLPEAIGEVDLEQLVVATEDFTGADLKRLVEDGKTLFAYDKARGLPLEPATQYFLRSVETVRANKERYAEAEAQARQRMRPRSPFSQFFGPFPPFGEDDFPE